MPKLTNVTPLDTGGDITDAATIRAMLEHSGVKCKSDHHGGWDAECLIGGQRTKLGNAHEWRSEVRSYTQGACTHRIVLRRDTLVFMPLPSPCVFTRGHD